MKTLIIAFILMFTLTAIAGEHSSYVAVAASQTDSKLGTGKVGNFLKKLICTVATSATSTVSLKDSSGASGIPLLAANSAIAVYDIPLEIRAKGTTTTEGFHLTTGAGVSCVAVGSFGAQVF